MSLIIPEGARPHNLHFGDDVQVRVVDSDMYNICDRLREIHPDMYIVAATRDGEIIFNIMDAAPDGSVQRIFRCKELDARVLEKVRYIMSVPFEERYALACREIDEHDAAQKEEQLEDLYERLGRPMWTQLEHDGFIDGRNKSYSKRGVMGPK